MQVVFGQLYRYNENYLIPICETINKRIHCKYIFSTVGGKIKTDDSWIKNYYFSKQYEIVSTDRFVPKNILDYWESNLWILDKD